jgi:hypothetical protein
LGEFTSRSCETNIEFRVSHTKEFWNVKFSFDLKNLVHIDSKVSTEVFYFHGWVFEVIFIFRTIEIEWSIIPSKFISFRGISNASFTNNGNMTLITYIWISFFKVNLEIEFNSKSILNTSITKTSSFFTKDINRVWLDDESHTFTTTFVFLKLCSRFDCITTNTGLLVDTKTEFTDESSIEVNLLVIEDRRFRVLVLSSGLGK